MQCGVDISFGGGEQKVSRLSSKLRLLFCNDDQNPLYSIPILLAVRHMGANPF